MKCTLNRYKELNELAKPSGIVIFGSEEDVTLPLGELRQAFEIEENMYNRSVTGLSVKNAVEVYKEYVAPLVPETVILHIGAADIEYFTENASAFDENYRTLIAYIKKQNKKCRIAVVSLRNDEENVQIKELNKHLKYIADSERCEYGDIASKKVWNPKGTRDAVAFVCSIGGIRSMKNRHPLYDLVRILYGYEASYSSM